MGIALWVSLGRVCMQAPHTGVGGRATVEPQFVRPSEAGDTLSTLPSLKLTVIGAFDAL